VLLTSPWLFASESERQAIEDNGPWVPAGLQLQDQDQDRYGPQSHGVSTNPRNDDSDGWHAGFHGNQQLT
ncbi:hypothetical protein XENOCAPTIV_027791, partial [Xenoophorus captivus]